MRKFLFLLGMIPMVIMAGFEGFIDKAESIRDWCGQRD